MRMRRKPWAEPELNACPFYIKEPHLHREHWKDWFSDPQKPLRLELGCGKGGFLGIMGVEEDGYNYIGVDIKSEVLAVAKRSVEKAYGEKGKPTDNIALLSQDIERIQMMLSPKDTVERIYINFCNPWQKPRHKKKRLTHTRQLLSYRSFLKDEGEIWFKTDDEGLFTDSLLYFKESGYSIVFQTRDLHASGFTESVGTEHEAMFVQQGIPIQFLIAVKEKEI